MLILSEKETLRFESKYVKGGGHEIWIAGLNTGGYGHIKLRGKMVLAHRLQWERNNGSIPEGMYVLHSCDTPACVMLEHLFLGTAQDNVDDMIAKKRKGKNQYADITHCYQGHEFTAENTRIKTDGGRRCRACETVNIRRHRRGRY